MENGRGQVWLASHHTGAVAVAFGGDPPPFEPTRSSVAALPAGAGHPRWGFSTSALGSLR